MKLTERETQIIHNALYCLTLAVEHGVGVKQVDGTTREATTGATPEELRALFERFAERV